MRVNERMKKVFSILLCLCMLVQNYPVVAFAAAEDNLCEHHTVHTTECGYVAAVAGADCTHTHDDACGYVCTHSNFDSTTGNCTDCEISVAIAKIETGGNTTYYQTAHSCKTGLSTLAPPYGR